MADLITDFLHEERFLVDYHFSERRGEIEQTLKFLSLKRYSIGFVFLKHGVVFKQLSAGLFPK